MSSAPHGGSWNGRGSFPHRRANCRRESSGGHAFDVAVAQEDQLPTLLVLVGEIRRLLLKLSLLFDEPAPELGRVEAEDSVCAETMKLRNRSDLDPVQAEVGGNEGIATCTPTHAGASHACRIGYGLRLCLRPA